MKHLALRWGIQIDLVRGLGLLALGVGLVTFGSSCTPSGSNRERRKLEKTALQIPVEMEPVSLDPYRVEDQAGLTVVSQLTEGLVRVNSQGQVVMGLAESYEKSSDGLVYTFKVRPEASWSDGNPIVADHFVLGLRRAVHPLTSGKFASQFFGIRGASLVHSGKSGIETLGVEAPNPTTVVIRLERSLPQFLEVLALPGSAPSRIQLSQDRIVWDQDTPSSGPYKLGAWKKDDFTLLIPSDYYWAVLKREQVNVRPVMLRVARDAAQAIAWFKAGQLDVLDERSEAAFSELESQKLGKVLSFSVGKSPFEVSASGSKSPMGLSVPRRMLVSSRIQKMEVNPWGSVRFNEVLVQVPETASAEPSSAKK